MGAAAPGWATPDPKAGAPIDLTGYWVSIVSEGRFHITWDNDTTLKIEADAGTQTRVLHFNATPPETKAPSWQG